ncbi:MULTISPECIES: class I SAM-dependent methyltransferase [Streptomyces]|uniref:class I SAM-dependent methyltransferase n=1 Tax=Streptomyces TaxID=1883 RepID=UPI000D527059|nr:MULTISPECIES: class I SAM-dependent methyltransferase [Streptomyces]AWE52055.1 SAM-dependent methyltransferase [Streptomyces nigra]MCF2538542.1 class I SAM-dependent methyltransferase [Streptomyces sp. FB2]
MPADFLEATRASYDTIAAACTDRFPNRPGDRHPLDRSLIDAFAELAAAHAPAPVADLGSGPGAVTAHLHGLGLTVFGVDLSPGMVALARRAHPALRFHVGSMTALDLPDGTLGGIVAAYSLIHVPDEHLADACGEMARVLRPGAPVLLAFQSGEAGRMHLAERFGRDVDLTYHWRTPGTVAERLAEAGLRVTARVLREPVGEEKRPRAFLLADKVSPR